VAIERLQLSLVTPSPPLTDGQIGISPLNDDNARQIAAICDTEGFYAMDERLGDESPDGEPCHRLRVWALSRSSLWRVDFEMPVPFVEAWFGIHEPSDDGGLAGIVGFSHPAGWSEKAVWANRINVSYWMSPTRRGKRLASRAVVVGLPWALTTYRVTEAFIHATSEASDSVAERSGFGLVDPAVLSSWLYPKPSKRG
jgi:RimJ/RimL family protein N-acetyltransferase